MTFKHNLKILFKKITLVLFIGNFMIISTSFAQQNVTAPMPIYPSANSSNQVNNSNNMLKANLTKINTNGTNFASSTSNLNSSSLQNKLNGSISRFSPYIQTSSLNGQNTILNGNTPYLKSNTTLLNGNTPELDSNTTLLKGSEQLLNAAITKLCSMTPLYSIPPIPEYFKLGADFNSANLPKLNNTIEWCKIPNWLGGIWYRKYETIISRNGSKTFPDKSKSEVYHKWGHQQDKTGAIWHLVQKPDLVIIDSENYFVRNYTQAFKIVSYTDKELIFTKDSFQIYINRQSGIIDKILQNRATHYYVRQTNTMLTEIDRLDWYDARGNHLWSDVRQNIRYKVRPFAPSDTLDNGIDARHNFINYLREIGQTNLIPQFDDE